MPGNLHEWMDGIGTAVDITGVGVIVIGMLYFTWRFFRHVGRGGEDAYVSYRQGIGRAILLGLEFLVAGDIIRTVVVRPTWDSVKVLGLIVLIRTFLSFSLQVELERSGHRVPGGEPREG
jgi:uncharacterized membrane protein